MGKDKAYRKLSVEEGEKEEATGEDALAVTLAEAVRKPMRGELEQLIASELALAVLSADPLQKIRHTLEAYRLLPPETAQELFSKEERDEFRRLYEVCISFMNTVENFSRADGTKSGAVAWSFSNTEAAQYLDFIQRVFVFTSPEFKEFTNELRSNDEKVRAQARVKYLKFLFTFLGNDFCPLSFIKQVESEFIVYAVPKISKLMRVIFTRVISADTWNQTLMLLRGKARQTM